MSHAWHKIETLIEFNSHGIFFCQFGFLDPPTDHALCTFGLFLANLQVACMFTQFKEDSSSKRQFFRKEGAMEPPWIHYWMTKRSNKASRKDPRRSNDQ